VTVTVTETGLNGCVVLSFVRRQDERGWFQRAYAIDELGLAGVDFVPKHANIAETTHAGTIRGMHYQQRPHGEAKLFHCLAGRVFDVAVDLRSTSQTFGKWFGIELSHDDSLALFIPEGFAHGYMSLDDDVIVSYFSSEVYVPSSEITLSPLNDEVGIDWPHEVKFISEKDASVPTDSHLIPSGY
jgi:dTDP-4-dehydrorhamnose 3,5-epimerase